MPVLRHEVVPAAQAHSDRPRGLQQQHLVVVVFEQQGHVVWSELSTVVAVGERALDLGGEVLALEQQHVARTDALGELVGHDVRSLLEERLLSRTC